MTGSVLSRARCPPTRTVMRASRDSSTASPGRSARRSFRRRTSQTAMCSMEAKSAARIWCICSRRKSCRGSSRRTSTSAPGRQRRQSGRIRRHGTTCIHSSWGSRRITGGSVSLCRTRQATVMSSISGTGQGCCAATRRSDWKDLACVRR